MKTGEKERSIQAEISAHLASDNFDSLCGTFIENSYMKPFLFAVKTLQGELADNNERLWQITRKFMTHEEWPVRAAACNLLPHFFKERKYDVIPLLIPIADDQDWRVREHAANAYGVLLFHYPFEVFSLFSAWIHHPSENVRRAIAVSTMKANKDVPPVRVRQLLKMIKPLLYDPSMYVRKNLGPFVLGTSFLNRHPHLTFEYLWRWLGIQDTNVRWNLAMSMSSSGGAAYPELALEYLVELGRDDEKTVWRAVASSLLSLARKRPETTLPVLNKWLADPQLRRPAEVAQSFLKS